MMNKMSILTVLVIGIAIVGLVSPVVAVPPPPGWKIQIYGAISDTGVPTNQWDVQIEKYYGGAYLPMMDPPGKVTPGTGSWANGYYETLHCTYPMAPDEISGLYKMTLWGGNNLQFQEVRYISTDQTAEYHFTCVGGNVCDCRYEWNYNRIAEIPEFSTIAIPVVSILGLLLFFNYRKRRGNK